MTPDTKRLAVPGHEVKIVLVSSWGCWNWNCECGQNGGGHASEEYAIAAGRRHEKKMARLDAQENTHG